MNVTTGRVNALDCENELFYPPFKLPAEKTGTAEERDEKTFSNDIADTDRPCVFSVNIIRARKLQ